MIEALLFLFWFDLFCSQLCLVGHPHTTASAFSCTTTRALRTVIHIETWLTYCPPKECNDEFSSEWDVWDRIPTGSQHFDNQEHNHNAHILFLQFVNQLTLGPLISEQESFHTANGTCQISIQIRHRKYEMRAYRDSHGKDDDEHDEVEGSGVSPSDVPHLVALGLRTWGHGT